jgi:branched-chain amino acid transport system ATP-binding protein
MLDEPSLGLAPIVIDTMYDTLQLLAHQQDVMILVAEQSARRALRFAHRTCVMKSGSIILSGTRDEVAAGADLVAAYLGK